MINVSPYCLRKIVEYIECKDCGPPTTSNYLWVYGLLFASLIESVCDQRALHIGRRIFVHTNAICNAEIFAKALRRKDMASPDKIKDEDEEEEEKSDSKKDGTLNIASKLSLLAFVPLSPAPSLLFGSVY
jgi:hypothetical protein